MYIELVYSSLHGNLRVGTRLFEIMNCSFWEITWNHSPDWLLWICFDNSLLHVFNRNQNEAKNRGGIKALCRHLKNTNEDRVSCFIMWIGVLYEDFHHWEKPYHHSWKITIIFHECLRLTISCWTWLALFSTMNKWQYVLFSKRELISARPCIILHLLLSAV